MKITQEKPEFKPITITLESKEEVELFWRAIRFDPAVLAKGERDILRRIGDWLSQEASL